MDLFESVAVGGRCLLGNSILIDDTGLATPWLIRTYHDLFRNVGFELEREELFEGEQANEWLQVVLSLFAKPRAGRETLRCPKETRLAGTHARHLRGDLGER